jgi:glyoxylase-like metal-dependent hydrolase (beta-lactamase superfamily II)
MHVLSGGRLRMRVNTYFPELMKEQTAEFPCSCFLIRHKQGNILFDTGCHPAVETDAAARWGEEARKFVPVHRVGDNVLGGLAKLKLGPADIDVVINSHLHMDHCGCNEFFRKAVFLIHADEIAAASAASGERRGYFRADWDHPMSIEAVRGEQDLFDDGRVVLLPLPGHTAGTIGARIELDRSGSFVLAADAAPVRQCFVQGYSPSNSWNPARSCASLTELQRLEQQGSTILFGHDEDQWLTLNKTIQAYD